MAGLEMYFVVILYAIYGALFVPIVTLRILKPLKKDEKIWYILLITFHVFALTFLILSKEYRGALTPNNKWIITFFILGYFVFFTLCYRVISV